MKVTKIFTFDAAHHLPNYLGPCNQLHGHTYRLEVTVDGGVDVSSGMVVDFKDLKKVVKDNVIDILDHSNLNNYIDNPTAENTLFWIKKKLQSSWASKVHKITKLRLWETPTSYATLEV